MSNQNSLRTGLLLLIPVIGLGIFGAFWKTPKLPVVLREAHYQVVWTDNGRLGDIINVAVWQRNQNVHDLSVTAKRVVLEMMRERRKAKKPMTPFMQVFFHYNKPKQAEVLNGEHRFTCSQWKGVTLHY